MNTGDELALCYVRGYEKRTGALSLSASLIDSPVPCLTDGEREEILLFGKRGELKMHYFKERELLPRVGFVLSFLRAIRPESLLDVGSGRGAFLIPFMREFATVPICVFDILPHRVQLYRDIAAGGKENLEATLTDITECTEGEGLYDVVTLLEVLEHIPEVERAVLNACRLARRFVIVTVPSHPDDNPEHIHLLTKEKLTTIFQAAGCRRLKFGNVSGHLTLIATKGE